jgi:3-oxoacyl-[acyl-carrier-protein] synthase II
MSVAGFGNMKALTRRNDNPSKACNLSIRTETDLLCRRWCVLILEDLEFARARGAKIYGEIIGFGMSAMRIIYCSDSEGDGAQRLWQVHKECRPFTEKIDYINAHGTSTPFNDRIETYAIKKVFGDHAGKLAISSNKSMIGHTLGAAGALEFASTLLTVQNDIIPPTINYETPDPDCDLDYVPNKARKATVNIALSNSFGFGGTNAVLVASKYNEKA